MQRRSPTYNVSNMSISSMSSSNVLEEVELEELEIEHQSEPDYDIQSASSLSPDILDVDVDVGKP